MSLWRRNIVYVGISTNGFAVWIENAWRFNSSARFARPAAINLVAEITFGETQNADTLPWEKLEHVLSQIKSAGATKISILVADSFARYLVIDPPVLSSYAELKALSTGLFESTYSLHGEEWEVRAEWQARKPFLACALPISLAKKVTLICDRNGFQLSQLNPYFFHLWNTETPLSLLRGVEARKSSSAFVALLGDTWTMLFQVKGRIAGLRSTRVAELETNNRETLVQAMFKREALRFGIAEERMPITFLSDGALDVAELSKSSASTLALRGRMPPAYLPSFAPQASWRAVFGKFPLLSFGLFFSGLLVAVALGFNLMQLEQQRRTSSFELARILENEDQVQSRSAQELSANERAQLISLKEAIAHLQSPWALALPALERRVPDWIALVSLDQDSNKRSLHVVAESKDADAMWRFFALLREEPRFADIRLRTHEVQEQVMFRPLRFSFDVSLR